MKITEYKKLIVESYEKALTVPLIKEDASLDDKLIEAAKIGNIEQLKPLIEQGANIHAKNDYPQRIALKNGHIEVFKDLVTRGADIHAQDDYALRLAAKNGYMDIVKLVVDNGGKIHIKNNEPLRLATQGNFIDIVKYLIDRGADIENAYSEDYNSETALSKTILEKYRELPTANFKDWLRSYDGE